MSLTTDDIDGIKQLLAASNRSLITELEPRFQNLDSKFDGLESKFDDLSAFVRDAIDTSNDATGEQLIDYERRITKLEQSAA